MRWGKEMAVGRGGGPGVAAGSPAGLNRPSVAKAVSSWVGMALRKSPACGCDAQMKTVVYRRSAWCKLRCVCQAWWCEIETAVKLRWAHELTFESQSGMVARLASEAVGGWLGGWSLLNSVCLYKEGVPNLEQQLLLMRCEHTRSCTAHTWVRW